jgi:hypothetical protein
MADENGITPKAKDGEPDAAQVEADQLAMARARRAQESDEEAAAAMGGKRGQAIDDQEPVGEEDDGQLFVWEQGRKVTLGTLISRGIPVEHAFVFGGKRLKGAGALVGFDDDVLVITRGRVGKTSIVPTRDDDEKVTKVVVETHIAAKVIAPADSEQGMDMLAAVFDKRGIKAA